MYCNQCGNMIPQNGAFCAFCGAKAEAPAQASAPVAAEPISAAPEAAPTTAPAPVSAVVQAPPVAESIPLKPKEKKEKPEKYYTTKHIVLCLVVAGIMAVAAGVFAGLYFSVI